MRVLSFQGLDDAADYATTVAPTLPVLYRELERRASAMKRDGHRSSSIPEFSSPTNELDDDGTPIPQHSDPTLQAVVQREQMDVACVQFTQAVEQARNALVRAVAVAAKAGVEIDPDTGLLMSAEQLAVKPKPPDEVWCRHHLGFGMHEPQGGKGRRGLCSFCDEFDRSDEPSRVEIKRLAASSLPPLELLERRASRSGRLSSRDYAEVAGVYRRKLEVAGRRRR